NTPILDETNQSFTATTNGNYAVEITQNGCIDTSACNTITGVGIIENDFAPSLTVYPNPTTGSFTIELDQNYYNVTVILSNSAGQVVSIQNYTSTNQLNLEINSSIGVYLVDIRTEQGKNLLIKVLKE
ncbi:MAG: T9SS type A sorting domain-containing protein, partial [Bacteroidia bacterium]|nr:T9SS type A sorting domain-containing protein [Bacteroidia bacterium]